MEKHQMDINWWSTTGDNLSPAYQQHSKHAQKDNEVLGRGELSIMMTASLNLICSAVSENRPDCLYSMLWATMLVSKV